MPFAEPEAENHTVNALASAVAELCRVAQDGSRPSLERCDQIVERFQASALDRRHRASSITALHLAIRNRMPGGAAKSHVDASLTRLLASLQGEGRFDAAENNRRAFSH